MTVKPKCNAAPNAKFIVKKHDHRPRRLPSGTVSAASNPFLSSDRITDPQDGRIKFGPSTAGQAGLVPAVQVRLSDRTPSYDYVATWAMHQIA